MTALSPGTIIDGKFEIVGTLGSGSMGSVYRARHLLLDRLVAVKIITETNPEQELDQRFQREAMAMSTLHHRNIVSFYGFGKWQGSPYLVMELISGTTLYEMLGSGALEPALAAEIMKQVCEALHCAHANGIIHRDLKPSNMILIPSTDGKPHVKLIDFGLAKLLPGFQKNAQRLTTAGIAVGSVLYMSPEQCVAHDVDPRSDIYAAGCILYQCLSGQPPFDGEVIEVMQQHVSCDPPELGTFSPLLAQSGLSAIASRAMAKAPADRYENASAMATDLEKAINHIAKNGTENYRAIPATVVSNRTLPATQAKPKTKWLRNASYIAAIALICASFIIWNYFNPNACKSQMDSLTLFNSAMENERCITTTRNHNILFGYQIKQLQDAIAQNAADHKLTIGQQTIAYTRLTNFYLNNQQWQKSLEASTQGLAIAAPINRERLQLLANHAKALEQLKTPLNALPVLERGLNNMNLRRPEASDMHAEVTMIYANLLIKANRVPEAKPILETLAKQCTKYPLVQSEASYQLGQISLSQKDYKQSIDYLERSLSLRQLPEVREASLKALLANYVALNDKAKVEQIQALVQESATKESAYTNAYFVKDLAKRAQAAAQPER